MKFIYHKLASGMLFMLLLTACTKEFEIATPEFEVTTESTTYKKGEPVTFKFIGDPQFVSFYSGQVGNDYAFKDGRITDVEALNLKLNSSVTNGAGTGTPQLGMFSLMVSSDFNGDYSTFSSIEAATWTDVSNRLTKTETTANSTLSSATPAAGIDLTDLVVAGKPLYIAFKYNIRPQSTHGIWRTWTFSGFSLSGTLATGASTTFGTMTTSGFRLVQKNPEIASRSTISTTLLTLKHADVALHPATAEIPTETWIISKPFDGVDKVDFGPDASIAIQGGTTLPKREHIHTFNQAGNYKVYFVAANTTDTERKEVVRELDITITD